MVDRIAHIGIAVKDLKASVALFARIFGKQPDQIESIPDQLVDSAMFSVGDSAIELLQATSPDSAIAKFIAKRGEGMHHISFVVDDIERELARLKSEGFQLIDEHPRRGADDYLVAFVHPKTANGVLIEISQKIA
jgi:methylmalonyl-CoA/ethylmalonyl-CoA epimerase